MTPEGPAQDWLSTLRAVVGNCWWMLAALLSIGLAGWAGFLYIGLRARRRRWLLAALGWAVYSAALLALHAGPIGPVPVYVWIIGMLAQLIHQFFEVSGWVVWRTTRYAVRSWSDQARARGERAPALDLNTLNFDDLARLLAVDPPWAVAIMATRARLGAFSSMDQLRTEARLPAHLFHALAPHVTVDPAGAVRPSSTGGRRLELG